MNNTQKSSGERSKALSLTDQAYARLRDEIITCALRPGTDIGEQELAARLSMSKTPVREALARLTLEGLVEAFPRRGYRVTPVTVKDITDIFTVRKALECVAAELAAMRMTDEELDNLEAVAQQTYGQDRSLPVLEFVAANNRFHADIALGARVPRLHSLITGYLEECTRLFHMGATIRDVTPETEEDHTRILKALRARDPAAAREAIGVHTENTRRGLLSALIADENSPLEL
ncbi:transcriptional regulator, GntR family [Pseudooceanicola antarcticus]|uniref:GntR family transcriptional regulator n=1 Tax=Pseudooceanicola antarcticus TaxID=1247613 RepID=A0A285JCJ4_9RHOB|nr:GntR family transcriptional regulator [Pseudooceanicola antarcticus]PJE30942.1 GntR family transcriptional regulator [Pseudooceanicola antarcticus]SNY57984.1 transcriptional regulator, GntR family [Pseudooceanicola antarcticus]